ncbi:MAG TPA: hypothetical protein VGD65_04275 [Chryseosolibacter sp.]
MLRKTSPMLFLLLICATTYAQKIAVKKIEVAGEKIIVHYDLDDGNPNNEYQISLYSSRNAFNAPLAKVSGDVGSDVKIGLNKKIIWNVKEELGPYKGKLSLEVRGKVYTPIVRLNNISTKSKFKRGKSHMITWRAGNSNAIHIELLKGGQRVAGELNQPNNGSFSLFVPQHAAVGKDYTLRIVDSRNAESVVTSEPFAVTRKVPLLLKVVPILAVGGVAAFLAGSGGGGGGGGNGGGGETPNEIPTPGFPGN